MLAGIVSSSTAGRRPATATAQVLQHCGMMRHSRSMPMGQLYAFNSCNSGSSTRPGAVAAVAAQRPHPAAAVAQRSPRAPVAVVNLPVFGISDGQPQLRILCYGDSITAGFCDGGHRFQPYAEALAEKLVAEGVPCAVTSCGLCGFTTERLWSEQGSKEIHPPGGPAGRGLARLVDDPDAPPTLVLIMSGTNDLSLQASVRSIMKYTKRLHAVCHERGVPTVVMAPTAHTAADVYLRRQLTEELARFAEESPGVVGFVDVEALVPRTAGSCWEDDQLHLSSVGSTQLGWRLAPHVAAALARTLRLAATEEEEDAAETPREVVHGSAVERAVSGPSGSQKRSSSNRPACSPQH